MNTYSLVTVLLGHILNHLLFPAVVDIFLSHAWLIFMLGSQMAHFSLFNSSLSINVFFKVSLVKLELIEHVLAS